MLVRGGASLTASVDGIIEIPVGGSAGFTWNANSPDGTKHTVAPVPMRLGTVSFTLGGAEPIAFAVYSDDDKSFDFYKRLDMPEVGDTFEGKVVTEVYTGFETDTYTSRAEVPWADHKADIVKIKVVDRIRPVSMERWFDMADIDNPKLTEADLSEVDTGACESIFILFQEAKSLRRIDGLQNWDTSSCTTMKAAFFNCSSLQSLDVSGWNTSSCTDMRSIFSGCLSLESLDVSGWNTSNVISMRAMFYKCLSLESLDVSRWDTSKVTTFAGMFAGYGNQYMKLRTVGDLSSWNTSNATDINAMFQDCEYLENIGDISGWDTSKVTNMSCLFNRCVRLDGIGNLSGWDTSLCNNFKSMFRGTGMTKTGMEIDVSFVKTWNVRSVTDLSEMFRYCTVQEELDLSGWDISAVKDMSSLFDGMTGLKKISLPASWKWIGSTGTAGYLPAPSSSNIPGADGKWYSVTTGRDYAPADIPAGKADTYVASKELLPKIAFAVYSADDASLDFYNRAFCDVPTAGDTFERKTVTDIYTGFEDTEYHVVSVGSNGNSWDADAKTNTPWFGRRKNIKTAQVVDSGIKPKSIQSWFQGLENATNLSMSKLDVSACASFCNAFANCQAATSIDVSGWSAKPVDMTQMFYMCKSVSTLDLSGFDGSRNITLNSTFHACFNLDDIKFGNKWTTMSVENFDCAFFGTNFRKLDVSGWNTSNGYIFRGTFGNMKNLEEIDISGWVNAGAEHDDQEILPAFDSDPKLRTVKVGSGWDWSKSNAKLLAISGENVAGADGKWYASSDGTGYAPADIPSGKADIYYSVAPSTFAVFSSDDGSLDFYNRAGKPVVGDTWQGKSVDGVYTGFETGRYWSITSGYGSMGELSDNNGNTDCPWWSHHDDIKSVQVIDTGIRPTSLAFWFQRFTNCRSIDLTKLDASNVKLLQHAFWFCKSITNLDLSVFADSPLVECDSMASGCTSLETVNISGWKALSNWAIAFSGCKNFKKIIAPELTTISGDIHKIFLNCTSLEFDLSRYDTTGVTTHKDCALGAPNVILPQSWK